MAAKKVSIAAATVFAALALLFFCLWISAKNDRSELQSLCGTNAAACAADFAEFERTGEEKYYQTATVEFYAFAEAYRALTDAGEDYSLINSVSACLTLHPEKAKAYAGGACGSHGNSRRGRVARKRNTKAGAHQKCAAKWERK